MLTLDEIRLVPKVLLHDHLDGGVRPATIIELARETGYVGLPTHDPEDLTAVLTAGTHRGHLNLFLDAFRHTIGVMQTSDALRRVAAECAEDLAADGVAYAEAGNPPSRHLDAFQYLKGENFHITIHAGEGFGLPSIWEAIQWCGTDRLGHGVRIVDDIVDLSGTPKLGRLAQYVRDKRIPLEMCPSSNVQTGAAKSIAEHPIGLLRRLQFRVTVNTDNRLMSGTSMSREMTLLSEAFNYTWADLQWFTINAMKSAFIGFDERLSIINTTIKPRYAALMG
jgi:adenosine deaminase